MVWSVHKRLSGAISVALVVCLLQAPVGLSADTASAATPEATHEQQVLQWRANRDAGLREENGWLSLVGLEWLQNGNNSIGSAADNSVVIAGGPPYWGDIHLGEDGLVFTPEPDAGILVDGQTIKAAKKLLADDTDAPTVVSFGNLSIQVIFRESYGLRISDSQAPARLNFQGVENFEIQYPWLTEGRFEAAETGQTIEIGNVLGQILAMPIYGHFEFQAAGKVHRLAAIGDEESDTLWFLFADRTSGRETYGAGRFLYSEAMPVNGTLLVDFNKAYNPPCAFNVYSTCPLPPLENRLDLPVTAGEKKFPADSSIH